MRTFTDAKVMAKALRAELRQRRQVDLGHSECLEIISRQFGYDDWNVLAAKIDTRNRLAGPRGARAATVPVLRVFSEQAALEFYVDFLGCTLDYGDPYGPNGSTFWGQVSRAGTSLMLTEAQYYARRGATVCIWLTGVDDLYAELHRKRAAAWSPAVWVPAPEPVPWGARVMTIVDPFGNHLLFAEPLDPRDQDLPGW